MNSPTKSVKKKQTKKNKQPKNQRMFRKQICGLCLQHKLNAKRINNLGSLYVGLGVIQLEGKVFACSYLLGRESTPASQFGSTRLTRKRFDPSMFSVSLRKEISMLSPSDWLVMLRQSFVLIHAASYQASEDTWACTIPTAFFRSTKYERGSLCETRGVVDSERHDNTGASCFCPCLAAVWTRDWSQ